MNETPHQFLGAPPFCSVVIGFPTESMDGESKPLREILEEVKVGVVPKKNCVLIFCVPYMPLVSTIFVLFLGFLLYLIKLTSSKNLSRLALSLPLQREPLQPPEIVFGVLRPSFASRSSSMVPPRVALLLCLLRFVVLFGSLGTLAVVVDQGGTVTTSPWRYPQDAPGGAIGAEVVLLNSYVSGADLTLDLANFSARFPFPFHTQPTAALSLTLQRDRNGAAGS